MKVRVYDDFNQIWIVMTWYNWIHSCEYFWFYPWLYCL